MERSVLLSMLPIFVNECANNVQFLGSTMPAVHSKAPETFIGCGSKALVEGHKFATLGCEAR